jgi:hypothetical protein
MFAEIVSTIGRAGFPKYVELFLADAIADPIKAHVDGLGVFLLDGILGQASGGGVVGLEWRGWLFVSEFLERHAKRAGVLGVDKESTHFGLGSAGQDGAHDLT